MKKIAIVVGARPQFIKLAPLINVLCGKAELIIIHTGQHYDFEMSDIFFRQLNLPEVDYHLSIGSENQATQVGMMMIKLEQVLLKDIPDMVVVIGDTNSTLAGALTASKNAIPLAHVEAGLRSKNNRLPEQINRIVADRLSDILCCPTESSVENLNTEGINKGVFLTGDILYDLISMIDPDEEFTSKFLEKNGLIPGKYILLTVHRAENVDRPEFLQALISGLENIGHQVFLPLHPRTKKQLIKFGLYDRLTANRMVKVSKPVGIVESLALTKSSLGVLTDSGGLQREAVYYKRKAYILRDETEWLELEKYGAVECIASNIAKTKFNWNCQNVPDIYFQKASKNIAECLVSNSD